MAPKFDAETAPGGSHEGKAESIGLRPVEQRAAEPHGLRQQRHTDRRRTVELWRPSRCSPALRADHTEAVRSEQRDVVAAARYPGSPPRLPAPAARARRPPPPAGPLPCSRAPPPRAAAPAHFFSRQQQQQQVHGARQVFAQLRHAGRSAADTPALRRRSAARRRSRPRAGARAPPRRRLFAGKPSRPGPRCVAQKGSAVHAAACRPPNRFTAIVLVRKNRGVDSVRTATPWL
jgi:hypothetical protein